MIILICGINGRMCSSIYKYLKKNKHNIIYGFDKEEQKNVFNDLNKAFSIKPDIVIDFTEYNISKEIMKYCLNNYIPVMSGTTGYKNEEILNLKNSFKKENINFYWSPNYSLGFNILIDETKKLRKYFNKYDIIEFHSKHKLDKPSGTSIKLAEVVDLDKSNINSIRMNDVLAIHSIIFKNDYENIILTHKILKRDAFLKGFIKRYKEFIGGIKW